MNNPGMLIIISSPSGGGKDAVINALLKIIPNSTRLITTTSRPPRPGNLQGVDYYFLSKEEFERKIENGDFVEHNFYAGNYYGAQKKHLKERLETYSVVFTQIEVNGKHNMDKAQIPNLSIFLLPESMEVLKSRIEKRGGITPELIKERLKIAEKEMSESADYDYRVINYQGKLEETVAKIANILQKELTKRLAVDKK